MFLKTATGFVVNRVLIPMINEAINCVHEGLASPDDIDVMMKLGANHPMGPLSLADLIGLDVVLDIMETLYQGFDDPKFRPSPLLKHKCVTPAISVAKGVAGSLPTPCRDSGDGCILNKAAASSFSSSNLAKFAAMRRRGAGPPNR